MKVKEAFIAWTPAHLDHPTAGQVKVGRLLRGGRDWTKLYHSAGGAANLSTQDLYDSDAVAQVFIEFHTLVVRDGIHPRAAHEAFQVIDEYAESIAIDISGARV